METVPFGKTERQVSRLGFGGAPAGLTNYLGQYSPADADQRDQVVAAIRHAVAMGVTYFDTAAGYGSGASERIFGEALAGHLDGVFLASKVAVLDADATRASVEASLTHLRCERLDLIQLHGASYTPAQVDQVLGPNGALAMLERMRDEGLVRYIGFTSEDMNPAVYRLIETGRFDAMQICYNLIFQHPAEQTRPFGAIFAADRAGMGVVTMRTLTSGIFQKWVRLVNPADTFDYNPALLQFVLSNPLVDVALVGMRTVAEVDRNVAICNNLAERIDLAALHERYVG